MTTTEPSNTSQADHALAPFTVDLSRAAQANYQALQRLDAVSKTLFARAQEQLQAEVELGAELLQCKDPLSAFSVYNRWMMRRTSSLLEETPKLMQIWLDLIASPERAADQTAATPSNAGDTGA